MKVLVVDDEKALRVLLPLYVAGEDVQVASDGLEGLAAAREFKPDLIISDVEMPGLGGPDFLDAYKAENPGVYAILMSGKPLEHFADKYPSAAKYAFLQKPFTEREFRKVLDKIRSA
ncbi:response regulator [Candidatus Woesearchaeota archaeon]|nr:response regulator [Candidatus Woesearchaeota archaeon]MBW3005530.1 response regulator [Candidatus Woesearchaeota archaeon]